MSIRDMMAVILVDAGWIEDPHPTTRKYRVFYKDGRKNKYFLGPNGAFRKGPCATRSVSCGGRDRIKVQALYDAIAAKQKGTNGNDA